MRTGAWSGSSAWSSRRTRRRSSIWLDRPSVVSTSYQRKRISAVTDVNRRFFKAWDEAGNIGPVLLGEVRETLGLLLEF